MTFPLVGQVKHCIDILETNKYEAYAVGGCVRDGIMGRTPKDWDVTTNALPKEIIECFTHEKIIETGIKHGTVTVIIDGLSIEITTFRLDGTYSDGRRPDNVTFVRSIIEDLSRRDFTMNAVAYHPAKGFLDPFNGRNDIENKVIRCVGDANERFNEDALRILRALRFASVLNFTIEKQTSEAIHQFRKLLTNISVERITAEFNKLLLGQNVKEILLDYSDVFCVFIPEMKAMIGFEQHNPHHHLDIWEHTVEAIDHTPQELIVRLTMFFHDIGKPAKFFTDSKGIGHFYNHPKKSAEITEKVLQRLKYDKNTLRQVRLLVENHDQTISPNEKKVKQWLNTLGEKMFRKLIDIKRADASAQSPVFQRDSMAYIDKLKIIFEKIIREKQCYKLKDLAVNGKDLTKAGIEEGPIIGEILEQILTEVINDRIPNDKIALLERAVRLYNKKE